MPHETSSVFTTNVIGDFIDRLRATEPITSVTPGAGDILTIGTTSTHSLRDTQWVGIDGQEYQITNMVEDVSFDIETTNTITATAWKAQAPYYRYGTNIVLNELMNSTAASKRYPQIALHELLVEDEEIDVSSNVLKTPRVQLSFMDEAQHNSWTNIEQHENRVQPMQVLKDAFVDLLKLSPYIGKKFRVITVLRADWGKMDNRGNVARKFDDPLSGVEMTASIPFLKSISACTFLSPKTCATLQELIDITDPQLSADTISNSPNGPAIVAIVCTGGGGAGFVNFNQSDGTLLETVPGAIPPTEKNIADSIVQSLGGGYIANVKSTDPLAVPHATLTLNTDPFTDVESAVTTDIQLVDQFGADIVPDSIVAQKITVNTGVTPSGISYVDIVYSGQTTQFELFDTVWLKNAGAYDDVKPVFPTHYARQDLSSLTPFQTLIDNNEGGVSTDRFTDSDNIQTYTKAVVKDHLTKRMWTLAPQSLASWQGALSAPASSSFEGFSGWRAPTEKEYLTLAISSVATGALNYAPFNNSASFEALWTCDTLPNSTGEARVVYFNLGVSGITLNINRVNKAQSRMYLMVRNF